MEGLSVVLVVVALIGNGIYQSSKNKQIAQPFVARASDPANATERLSAAMTQAGWKARAEWQATEDGQAAVFVPKSGLRQIAGEFSVRTTVGADGQIQAVLANDGAALRSMLLGFIPTGPKIPVGGLDFLKLKRKLAMVAWPC